MENSMERTTSRNKRIKMLAIAIGVGVTVFMMLTLAAPMVIQAAPQHGFGQGHGRTDTVNVNDYHTSSWKRFEYNYQFQSGSDHRFELGRPTTFSGTVPVNVQTVNFRRDANVSLRPPSYGVFSGHVPTEPSNLLFKQPVNPHFHRPIHRHSENLDPKHDTLQQGVNAQPVGNPMNMQQNVTTGEFLPSTSIKGEQTP